MWRIAAIVWVLAAAGVAQAQQMPTFSCGFLGPPADSGVLVSASNPVVGAAGEPNASQAWACTVTCAFRTSDSTLFSAFTCTGRVRLGADNEELCREGPGLDGAPFSDGAIITSSCQ